MALSQDAYILDGFAEDCEELIQRCTAPKRQVYLRDFTRIWHEMQLGEVYSMTPTDDEREVLLRHIQIAKQFMVSITAKYEEAVVGLFILYKLMTMKPFEPFACVTFVPEDIPALDRLEAGAKQSSRSDVLYMLKFVLSKGLDPRVKSLKDRELRIGAHLQGSYRKPLGINFVRGVSQARVSKVRGPELSTLLERRSIQLKRHSRVMEGLVGPNDTPSDYDETIAKKMAASFEQLSIGQASPPDGCIPSTSGLCRKVSLKPRPIPVEPVEMNPVVSVGLDHEYAARSAKGKRPANETQNKVKSSKKPKTTESFEVKANIETKIVDSGIMDPETLRTVPGPSSAGMAVCGLEDQEAASTISMAETLELDARVVLKPKRKRLRINIQGFYPPEPH